MTRRLRAIVVLLSLLAAASADAGDGRDAGNSGGDGRAVPRVRRYDVFAGRRAIGSEVCTIRSTSDRFCAWEFHDRGLGPKSDERIVVDSDGIPTRIEEHGLDYGHQPVDERFVRDAAEARWTSASETGHRAAPGRAFYVSLQQLPEEEAVLARALLRAPDHRLALLPGGEAAIERVGATEVRVGKARQSVTLYQLTGLDLAPDFIWLDGDGELFCVAGTILAGWTPVAPTLAAEEARAMAARGRRLVATLAHPPKRPLAIVHARLFDAAAARIRPNMTVLVDGERFAAVAPDDAVALPAGAEVIDAAGKTLLPGLWDLHAHLDETAAVMLIAAGVTSARDMAANALGDPQLSLAKHVSDGDVIGPRILRVGLMDGPGPGESHAELVRDAAEVEAAIARDAAAGFPQVKVYNSFDPKLIPTFVREAHRRGLRVSGHVPNGMKAADLVTVGFDELQHAYFVLLNFLPETELMPMARFLTFADHAGEIDFSSPKVRAFIALLRRRGVDIDLTLVSGERYLMSRAGAVSPTYAAVADRLPAQTRRMLLDGGGLPNSPGSAERHRAAFAATLKLARALFDAGVPIAVGTDEMLYGFSFERELELLVQAGIPAADVLRLATLGNARIMKRDRELGSIAPGKLADFVLVDGDPTARISAVRRPVLVGKGGTLFRPAELYRSLGIAP